MTDAELQAQALSNARNGGSFMNYSAILRGFIEKGIAEAGILPRVNVFTFHAWKALGRVVRKGEHGVKVCTYVPMSKGEDQPDGSVKVSSFRRPRVTTVFHVSQTEESANAKN